MKSCTRKKCQQNNPQPLSEFHKHKNSRDGHGSLCKSCKKEYNMTYLEKVKKKGCLNIGTHKQCKRKDCKQDNPQPVSAFSKTSNSPDGLHSWCKICKSAAGKEHYEKNKVYIISRNSKYKTKRMKHERKNRTEFWLKFQEDESKRHKEYRERNPGIGEALSAKRRAAEIQRTPSWANHDSIDAIYIESKRLTKETGIPHHVDHIIPLQGKLVSGLHVETNLKPVPATENLSKSNSFTPGSWPL